MALHDSFAESLVYSLATRDSLVHSDAHSLNHLTHLHTQLTHLLSQVSQ